MRLDIFGYIGDAAAELDAQTLINEIRAAGESERIDLHINSGGGLVFEGLAVFNALQAHKGGVTVTVDAIAASMASVIAMAGQKIVMPENSMMMIHNPAADVSGTADDFEKTMEDLRRVETMIAEIYSKRSGLPIERVLKLMAVESWFSGPEAVEMGFADEVQAAVPIAAFAKIDFAKASYRVPSNILAKFRDSKSEDDMTTKTMTIEKKPTPEKGRTKVDMKIRAAVNGAGLDKAFADGLIAANMSIEDARAKIINKLADDQGPDINRHAGDVMVMDRRPAELDARAEALTCRMMPGTKPSDAARPFMGASPLDHARDLLMAVGEYKSGMSRESIFRASMTRQGVFHATAAGGHSTSDFPGLLQDTGNRILLKSYEAAQSGIKPLSRERQADDFRPLSTLRVSESPELLEVAEGGEVKFGTVGEAKETYGLASYARIFKLTRQAVINDDLMAFSDFFTMQGRAAAEKEAKILFTLINANPTMNEDSKALFHADHGNLASLGGAIDVTTLGAARKALRQMTGLDGVTPVNAVPAFLLVGPERETEAEQVLASISANTVAEANPFSQRLQLLVEPRFGTSLAWYVFADPAFVPVLEHAYLSSALGPQMESREGFETLGIEYRVLLDFGAGAVDWRGVYKNPGE